MVEPSLQIASARDQRLARMLEARSIAVVGASDRAGSFGLRLATEVLRSPAAPRIHLVHPTRSTVLGQDCLPSLAAVPEPVDLVLLGVPDSALVDQVKVAAGRGDGGAVVFGSAHGLGDELVAAAGDMPLCGGGCMGFLNVAKGVRAIGYIERHPLSIGGIALVSHSGSVFSALLRTHRRLEFALAVSSGQELVTTAADYLSYALMQPETRVIGLFLETLRDVDRFRRCLATAADRDIPVVALPVGHSARGQALVEAHSGALAGDGAAWEALFATYGVHHVRGLDEMVDCLEAFSIGRRRLPGSSRGIATVHDSGAERVLVADVAQSLGIEFAEIADDTRVRLQTLIDPGLQATNPLDVWGTGADTASLFAESLSVLASDDHVAAVALAVDLVPEYDGDEAYCEAVEKVLDRTDKPVVVLTNLAASVDQGAAGRLRAQGVPVLEGTWSGLGTLRHLLEESPPSRAAGVSVDNERRGRWRALLVDQGVLDQVTAMALLADYGIDCVTTRAASSAAAVLAAARDLRYPVVLKTDEPEIAHKAAAGGVVLDLWSSQAVRRAYARLSGRLGPRVVVQPQMAPGLELYLGILRDPMVGPIVMVGLGGGTVEAVRRRRLALPPLGPEQAVAMLGRLGVLGPGSGTGDSSAVVDAVLAVSQIAVELGDAIAALDVNPLVVTPDGAIAVDALALPRIAGSLHV